MTDLEKELVSRLIDEQAWELAKICRDNNLGDYNTAINCYCDTMTVSRRLTMLAKDVRGDADCNENH